MASGLIVDVSFGHAKATPANLRKVGAVGVIFYAGCADTAKNVTKDEFQAVRNAGYWVGLVIENGPQDALKGGATGTAQGKAILAAAKTLGYDYEGSVLFCGADFNETSSSQYKATLACTEAFGKVVSVPGYYGDSDSIDYIHARQPQYFWQSDSRSFSPRNPTPNAHLLQVYNDPRVKGMPFDLDEIKQTPMGLMGEPMLSTADIAEIKSIVDGAITANNAASANAVWAHLGALWNKSTPNAWAVLSNIHQNVQPKKPSLTKRLLRRP